MPLELVEDLGFLGLKKASTKQLAYSLHKFKVMKVKD